MAAVRVSQLHGKTWRGHCWRMLPGLLHKYLSPHLILTMRMWARLRCCWRFRCRYPFGPPGPPPRGWLGHQKHRWQVSSGHASSKWRKCSGWGRGDPTWPWGPPGNCCHLRTSFWTTYQKENHEKFVKTHWYLGVDNFDFTNFFGNFVLLNKSWHRMILAFFWVWPLWFDEINGENSLQKNVRIFTIFSSNQG